MTQRLQMLACECNIKIRAYQMQGKDRGVAAGRQAGDLGVAAMHRSLRGARQLACL